jgi:Rieske Fe-S protein
MAQIEDRRSFLRWAIHGLSALFAVIFGAPAVLYLIDSRNRKAPPSDFRLVDGIRLDEVSRGGGPAQGVIRDVRVDGWTLHPNDVIGRVWVVPADNTPGRFRVFTTICPHLGCSVNLADDIFACPCHNARFEFDGKRIEAPGQPNPALRGMDELDWQRDTVDPERILVRYESFRAGTADKTAIR